MALQTIVEPTGKPWLLEGLQNTFNVITYEDTKQVCLDNSNPK